MNKVVPSRIVTLLLVTVCIFICVTSVSAQTPTVTPDIDLADPEFLLQVNPLTINDKTPDANGGVGNAVRFLTPARFLQELFELIFPLAGIILFIMIVWGGFEMLSQGAGSDKALESGKQRITAAIIGFALLFCSYWIAQIVQYIFGVNILG